VHSIAGNRCYGCCADYKQTRWSYRVRDLAPVAGGLTAAPAAAGDGDKTEMERYSWSDASAAWAADGRTDTVPDEPPLAQTAAP